MRGRRSALFVLFSLSAAVLVVAPLVGMHALSWRDIWPGEGQGHRIFWELRLPRVCLAWVTMFDLLPFTSKSTSLKPSTSGAFISMSFTVSSF